MSSEHADSSWRVRVDPHGFEFDCRDGDNAMAAVTRAGCVWPTAFSRTAQCALFDKGRRRLDTPTSRRRSRSAFGRGLRRDEAAAATP